MSAKTDEWEPTDPKALGTVPGIQEAFSMCCLSFPLGVGGGGVVKPSVRVDELVSARH